MIKKVTFLLAALLLNLNSNKIFAQGNTCASATPFCSSVGTPFSFPNTYGGNTAPVGPSYGCLCSQPNPSWFYLKSSAAGVMAFTISEGTSAGAGNLDADFIAYGPYTSSAFLNVCSNLTGSCGACSTNPNPTCSGNIADCSYSTSATENMTLHSTSAGQYYLVMVTNYAGTAGMITVTQTSGPGTNCSLCPTLTLSATPDTVCLGSSTTLSVTGMGANGTYTWTTSAGTVSTGTNTSIVISPSVTTTYSVIGTDSANACSSIKTKTVTVLSHPVVSYTLTASSTPHYWDAVPAYSSNVTNARWYWGDGTYTVGLYPSHTYAAAGTYSICVTAYSSCGDSAVSCQNDAVSRLANNNSVLSSMVYINVVSSITTATASPSTICAGGTTTLTASGATTYSWSPATGLSATTGSVVTASPTVTITYTVVGTTGASTVSTAVTVSVNPVPSYSLATNIFTICNGGSQTFTVSGASTYTWSPATTLNNPNTANPTASPTTTMVYSVTGTNMFGCTNATPATVTVNVVAPPNLTVSSSSYTICNGSSQGLSVSGASTYTWSPAASLSNPNSAHPTASPTTTTIYTVSGIAGSCAPSAPVTVTVVVIPSPTVSVSGGGANFQTVCAGGFVSPINFSVSPAGTVSWVNSGTAIGLAPSGSGNISGFATPTVSVQTVGVITVNATASGTGCNSTSNTDLTYTITINPLPSVTLTASNNGICSGNCVALTEGVTGGTPAYTYILQPGNITVPNYTVCPTTTTTYTYIVTDANNCSSTSILTVTVFPLPTVTCSATPDTILAGNSSVLNASVFGGVGPYTYIWAPAATLSAVTGNSVVATPIVPTCYTITVMDATGCENMCSICVHINSITGMNKLIGSNDITIYPNPNNGSFVIEPNSATKQIMQVYDVNAKLVLTQTINGKTSIDASSLGEGVYNISISSKEGIINKRIVLVK